MISLIATGIAAIGVVMALFIGMYHLTNHSASTAKNSQTYTAVDFIRTPPKQQIITKERVKPKTPPQVIKKPTPMKPAPTTQRQFKPIALNVPQMAIKMPKLNPLIKGKQFLPTRTEEFATGLMPLVNIPPVYPRKAKIRRIQGYVKVGFIIDKKGHVKEPFIIEAKPKHIFNKAVLKAIKKWKFRPQKDSNGIVTEQKASQMINFTLK